MSRTVACGECGVLVRKPPAGEACPACEYDGGFRNGRWFTIVESAAE